MNKRHRLNMKLFAILLTVVFAASNIAMLTSQQAICGSGFLSSVYTIDHTGGTVSNIIAGTDCAQFKAGFTNAAELITIYDQNGAPNTDNIIKTGMSAQLTADGSVAETLQIAVKGDASGDGQISISDYTLARLHILGLKSLSGAYQMASDVSADGKISISDYTLMRLHILGLRSISADKLPLAGHLIGIDPGHQAKANPDLEQLSPNSSEMNAKVSSGTTGRFTNVHEYVVNLQVALKLRQKLEALGATVIMTRETHDINISNAERAQKMNGAGVDCWLRIHANGSENTSKYGMEILIPVSGTMNTTDPAVQQKSEQLASVLLENTVAATGAKNNGLSPRSDQTGFCWSSVPVCNIEMGYMTYEPEDRLLITDEYQEKIASGLVQGFLQYFG